MSRRVDTTTWWRSAARGEFERSALVALFISARVRPQRLGTDTQSFIEVGPVMAETPLVGPLTESIYTTLLTEPLLVLYIFLSRQWLVGA